MKKNKTCSSLLQIISLFFNDTHLLQKKKITEKPNINHNQNSGDYFFPQLLSYLFNLIHG